MSDHDSTSKLRSADQGAAVGAASVSAADGADVGRVVGGAIGTAVRARGWILAMVIVGLWIGAGQLWRPGEPPQPIAEAEYSVDINQASEMDLLNLPEVGPTLAGNILSYRQQHGDFRSFSEVGEVPGVGPQTLKQLAPFVTCTPHRETAD